MNRSMNITTFLALLDRHGPEMANWPQDQRESMQTFLRESALLKVTDGQTTLREINKVTFVQ